MCTNVNECLKRPCLDHNAKCRDTEGSFECNCDDGFVGNGLFENGCVDINECIEPSTCVELASCENTIGSFQCSCFPGYEGDGVDHCEDINECSLNPCVENADCKNHAGGFECECRDGMFGSGITLEYYQNYMPDKMPTNYTGLSRFEIPAFEDRIFIGCKPRWGEWSDPSPADCPCETSIQNITRVCLGDGDCDTQYCDFISLDLNTCTNKILCDVAPCPAPQIIQTKMVTEFETEFVDDKVFCETVNEMKTNFPTAKVKIRMGEFSTDTHYRPFFYKVVVFN